MGEQELPRVFWDLLTQNLLPSSRKRPKSIWIQPKRSLCCYESVTAFTQDPIRKVEIFSGTFRQAELSLCIERQIKKDRILKEASKINKLDASLTTA